MMIKKMLSVAAMALSLASGAATYYVDANFGNDAWDGSKDFSQADPGNKVGPKKTLVAVMKLATLGDTIYAAEGDYNQGEELGQKGWTSNRVVVKAGVLLTSVAGVEKTFISGHSSASNSDGCGPDAVSCVYFSDERDATAKKTYGLGIVRGFTIRNGRTMRVNYSKNGRGAGVLGKGLVVDCILKDHATLKNGRGTTMSDGVTALRCEIGDPVQCPTEGHISGFNTACQLIDCLLTGDAPLHYKVYCYNCTFAGNAFPRSSKANCESKCYNCLFLGSGTSMAEHKYALHYNTRSRAELVKSTGTTYDGDCLGSLSAAQTAYDASTARPLPGSVAIDTGKVSYYKTATNGWKKAWLEQCGTDFAGYSRIIGSTIDVGCGEHDWTTVVIPGLTWTTNVVAGGIQLDVSRNYTSEMLTLGFRYGSDTVLFADHAEGYTWSTVVADLKAATLMPTYALVQLDWYADAENGDDANMGYSPRCPVRTLARIGARAQTSGSVIHAGRGVYDTGEMGLHGTNRIAIAAGVSLLADGDASDTVIVGHRSTLAGNSNGHGSDSVRAVYMGDGAVIRGFTIRDGYTTKTDAEGEDASGGGICGAGLAVDCVFENCRAQQSGDIAAYGTTLLRCRIVQNANAGTLGAYDVTMIDSVYDYPKIASYGKAYNTTFRAMYGTGGSGNKYAHRNCLIQETGSVGSHSTFENCSMAGDIGSGCETNLYCRKNVGAEGTATDANFVPQTATAAIDCGDNAYRVTMTNGWSAVWQSYVGDRDFIGHSRIVSGTVDAGACEFSLAWVVVPGLTKTVESGAGGQTLTLRRNYTGERLILGFTYGDETVTFADHEEGYVWSVTVPDVNKWMLVPFYSDSQTEWYADAENGDDANGGFSPYCPVKTLARASSLAQASGDVIHAARGVYREGVMYLPNYGSNRVVLAKGVKLVATEGPDVTFIEGQSSGIATTLGACGVDSLRAVFMNDGAILKGFTVTNGHASTAASSTTYRSGGGVWGGLSVNCRFVGNRCSSGSDSRGDAARGAILLRCYIGENKGSGFCVNNSTKLIECIYDSSVYAYDKITAYDTTFRKSYIWSSGSSNDSQAYNCIFFEQFGAQLERHVRLHSCMTKYVPPSNVTDADGKCRFGVDESLIDIDWTTGRPRAGSAAIDAGTDYRALATNGWSAAYQAEYTGDYSDGQRVYNGAIDIGCGEYDCRADFEPNLGKCVTIEKMGENVTTNAIAQVVVPAGDSLTVALPSAGAGVKMLYTVWYTPFDGTRQKRFIVTDEPFHRTFDGPCTYESFAFQRYPGLVVSVHEKE